MSGRCNEAWTPAAWLSLRFVIIPHVTGQQRSPLLVTTGVLMTRAGCCTIKAYHTPYQATSTY